MREFSHTATDLLLTFIDLLNDDGSERAELIADSEKSIAEMTKAESDDLAPDIRRIIALLIASK